MTKRQTKTNSNVFTSCKVVKIMCECREQKYKQATISRHHAHGKWALVAGTPERNAGSNKDYRMSKKDYRKC